MTGKIRMGYNDFNPARLTETMSDRKTHWENVYASKSPVEVSWYQQEPALSLRLIRNTGLDHDAPIIDVGGGSSTLVDHLCNDGFKDISVLDVSARALAHAKLRLAEKASGVKWLESDVTELNPSGRFALWHDRAVFHFLTANEDRKSYVEVLKRALKPGGHLIIMAFAIDGPKKCSGLDIVQYDAEKLMAELGENFELLEQGHQVHITPAAKEQKFAYFHFTRSTKNSPNI
jgi:SAM-dependent methyltransferase